MVRAIDADKLLEQLQKKKCGPANKRYTEGFNDCLMRVRSMIHSAPTLPPPNEPLTWNELGNMVEKPVYIVELEDGESCWVLVHTVDDIKALFVSAFDQYDYGNRELYGQTWLVYRRPPEVSP